MWYFLLFLLAPILLIGVFKLLFRAQSTDYMLRKNVIKTHSSLLKKYPSVDTEKFRGIFWRVGLLLALGFVLYAFNWREQPEEPIYLGVVEIPDEMEVLPPRIVPPPPPPPPPPAPPKLEVVEDEEILEEEPEILDLEAEEETVIETPPPPPPPAPTPPLPPKPVVKKTVVAPPPPPPPPPPPVPTAKPEPVEIEIAEVEEEEEIVEEVEEEEEEPEEPELFTIVEEMPEFPGGVEKLFAFLNQKIKYPAIARENGIEGTVYVGFIVMEDGSIQSIHIKRGLPGGGAGCDEEAIRVTQLLPKWKPGKQRGRPVRVAYTLPFKFKLD